MYKKTQLNDSIDMILISGETGVGKSTFINAAGPIGKMAVVGHALESCTAEPEGYLIEDNERRVVLVDTPGFNNSIIERGDDDILRAIIAWLQDALRHDENAKLAGIIYLHDVTNVERRVPKLIDALNLYVVPAVILATVQCHGGPISDQKSGGLKERYPNIFTGDHFGRHDQQTTALALIDKVIESRTPAPLSSVIQNLQRLRDNHALPKVVRLARDLLSSYRASQTEGGSHISTFAFDVARARLMLSRPNLDWETIDTIRLSLSSESLDCLSTISVTPADAGGGDHSSTLYSNVGQGQLTPDKLVNPDWHLLPPSSSSSFSVSLDRSWAYQTERERESYISGLDSESLHRLSIISGTPSLGSILSIEENNFNPVADRLAQASIISCSTSCSSATTEYGQDPWSRDLSSQSSIRTLCWRD
ncbi:hypothetical protein D9619_000447 [Psilocybe cf. subviscida]|uniref:G domain-containing protein n=1 Tax=Psilocybe cf. subviscida TaxID=2480587 RepID=A0A8H5BH65_9AGAR|nr:hypothetical protein D9619_000447 [Psilocybe cf. subviscida]